MGRHEEDEPTVMMVDGYDLMNMPGIVRARLIKAGKMGADQFTTPANMPGKKLKELRDARRGEVMGDVVVEEPVVYSIGDVITYKAEVYEILEIDDLRVKIFKDDKNKWVNLALISKG